MHKLDALPRDFRTVEMAWVQEHRDELVRTHAGEWIAVEGAQLVASADDLATLLTRAAAAGHPDPFITAIPSADAPRYFVGCWWR